MAERKKEGERNKQEEVTGLAIQGARATFLNQLPRIVIKIQRESACDLELICYSGAASPDRNQTVKLKR